MLTLKQLEAITDFDDIIVPFSEKLVDGKVFYRNTKGVYIHLTNKQHIYLCKFHTMLRKHLLPDLKLIKLGKTVSFYMNSESNYFELRKGKLEKITEEVFTKRCNWIDSKQRQRNRN